MSDFLKNNRLYFFLYLIVLIWAAYYLFQFDKVSLHIKINKLTGNALFDTFFKYFTHIGDGLFAVAVSLIILLFYNIRKGLYLLSAYLLSGAITSVLKNYFYDDVNRPHFVFGYFVQQVKLNYIEGVDMVGLNSFPSGHATSAFAIFTAMAFISSNKILKVIFFMLALASAFSRTYLSQHWLVDITVGSIIGTSSAIALYFVFVPGNKLEKLNKSLLNLKRA